MNALYFSIFFFFSLSVFGQDSKYHTIDEVITTLYSVISGPAGEARDWERFRDLFSPDGKLIPVRKNQEGAVGYTYMTPDDYINGSGKWLEENGFYESEIYRVTEEFGLIAHVFTTYEFRVGNKNENPNGRGINSIQLYKDGKRWYITNISWNSETAENPLPVKYLPMKE